MDKLLGWQPIETAPKCTSILVWDADADFATEAHYVEEEREREVYIKTDKEGNEIYKREKYKDGYWSPANCECSYNFSHWMPLPKGPE